MPYLRQEGDNSIGDTLSGLGKSLSDAFNPLNRLRAYDIQQQIWLRNEQLRQEQRKNAAQLEAVRQWGHIVPPDKLPYIANQIYQGAPYDQIARAAAELSGNMIDDTTPEATQHNIRYMEHVTGKPWTELYPPIAGDKTGAAARDIQAKQKGTEAASTEFGTQTGKQAAIGGKSSEYIDADSPAAEANNRRVFRELNNGQEWEAGMPVPIGPNTGKAYNDRKVQQSGAVAGETARAGEVGKQVGGGITPSGQLYPFGLPGSPTNPFPTTTSPAPAPAPAPTPDTPNVSLTNPSNPSATPTPIVRQTSVGPVVGQAQPEAEKTAILDKATRDNLQEAIDAGVAGIKLKSITGRIRQLADLAGTGGPEQLPTAITQKLADMGLRFTKRSEILAEMDSLYKAQIPELRKDMGVKFEAGPELSAQSKMVGVSNLPPDVIKGILARQDAIADLGIQRRDLARRAIGQDPENPLAMPDYYKEENKIYQQLPQHTQELLKLYGANAATSSSAPPVTQSDAPPTPAPDLSSALSNFVHWFTGGYQAPAAPAPGPTPTPVPNNSSVEIKPNPDGTFPDAPR